MPLCVPVSAPFGLFPPVGCRPLCFLFLVFSTFWACRPVAARPGQLCPAGTAPGLSRSHRPRLGPSGLTVDQDTSGGGTK
jgi:hypothetical protein